MSAGRRCCAIAEHLQVCFASNNNAKAKIVQRAQVPTKTLAITCGLQNSDSANLVDLVRATISAFLEAQAWPFATCRRRAAPTTTRQWRAEAGAATSAGQSAVNARHDEDEWRRALSASRRRFAAIVHRGGAKRNLLQPATRINCLL